MNVTDFECLLGLAGSYLIKFNLDELYGCEASRSLVYSKLYEARIKTGQNYIQIVRVKSAYLMVELSMF
jgi:hypothetical protein